jgi:hypothetical protein
LEDNSINTPFGIITLKISEWFKITKITRINSIIPNYSQQDATFLDLSIFADALHVSGSFSTHHQEHITVHIASGIVNQYGFFHLFDSSS